MKETFKSLSESDQQIILTHLNSVVLSELKPVCLGLAILYLIFAISHFIFLDGLIRSVMTITASISVTILLILNIILHKVKVNPRNAHVLGFLIALIVLFNGILHLDLSGDAQQTTNLMLLILGTGFLFLSSVTYFSIIVITMVSWMIVAITNKGSGNWFHFGFFLLSAIILSWIIFVIRKRSRVKYERIQLSEIRHSEELSKAITALEESQEKYRDLFENANDLIQSVGADGKFDYVNRAWENVLEYDSNDRKNLNFLDTIREDNRGKCADLFHKVGQGEVFQNLETVFLSKTGKEIYVEGSINPQIKDGKFISTRAIFRDITKRKTAENELNHLHEELKNVNERLKEAYSDVKFEKDVLQNVIQDEEIALITDSSGLITAITEKARNLTSKSRLEILNSQLTSIFNDENHSVITEAIRLANIKNFHSFKAILKTDKPTEIEYIVNVMKLNALKEKQLLVVMRIDTE